MVEISFVFTVLCGVLAVPLAGAFNFDPRGASVLQEPRSSWKSRESYFGYSVALYSVGTQAGIIVSAPRANSTQANWTPTDIPEPGALYVCPLDDASSASACSQILVDKSGNDMVSGIERYRDRKDYSWLGVSLDLHESDYSHIITTCAHRWINQLYLPNDDYFMNGACYWADLQELLQQNFQPDVWKKLLPLVDYNSQRIQDPETGQIIYYYQLGQVGTSAHILQDGRFVLGAPGVKQWAGTVAMVQRGEIWTTIAESTVLTPVKSYDSYSYFGYSVTSGKFWGSEEFIVAGAPRADMQGKVSLLNTNGVLKWEVSGTMLGSGFGSVVAAGDVTGDGWAELFVGAPLYSDRTPKGGAVEAVERGAVFVYKRGAAEGLIFHDHLRASPPSPHARFGSAIAVIGDIDRDGFQDLAVGAPHEDDGAGAVYIFMGGADGVGGTASQHLRARDFGQVLRGFGAALSRGVDVDGNGYPDLGVGAYAGEGGAVVVRTRPVATVDGRVSSDREVITEAGQEFTASACLSFAGHNVQDKIDMKVELILDEGTADRAYFLAFGTGVITEEVELKRDVKKCLNYVIKLKDDLKNATHPLDIVFKFTSDDLDPASPWCPRCGVAAPSSPAAHRTSVPLALGCGDDAVCTPTLALEAAWVAGVTDGQYILGTGAGLYLAVEVGVGGEPAYKGWVGVTLPPGLTFRYLPYKCVASDAHSASCSLDNPVRPPTEKLTLVVQEEAGQLGSEEGVVKVLVSAGASGAKDEQKTLTLGLVRDVRLFLSGNAEEESLHYDPATSSPQVTVRTFFQVGNQGTTASADVPVKIFVPVAFSPSPGFNFGEVLEVSPAISCSDEGVVSDMDGITVGEVSKPPFDTTLSVTCAAPGFLCHSITCMFKDTYQVQTFSLNTRYDFGQLQEKYGSNATASIHTWAAILSSEPGTVRSGLADVWVTVAPKGWRPPVQPVPPTPAWVYLVSVLAGLILLVVIIFVLFKVGFFRRKRPQVAQEEGQGNEEGSLTDTLAEDFTWQGGDAAEEGGEPGALPEAQDALLADEDS
ncbi:integrin alpha-9-like [Penaeus chinensis]|uniref:integrin alpha-9-like n=1 Tax=Penaeus chinensis TaxID=139456 RepID=UPI001FB76238|nr:integrin alpha-9-like [Penaeus chinensis]